MTVLPAAMCAGVFSCAAPLRVFSAVLAFRFGGFVQFSGSVGIMLLWSISGLTGHSSGTGR